MMVGLRGCVGRRQKPRKGSASTSARTALPAAEAEALLAFLEKTEAILAQARFLLRCASKWSLTTGRYPLPLIAALVAFSAEVNGVTSLSVEDIAQDISAGIRITLRRYKELVDALVHVARQLLPRGADVNAKNLLLNAQVLLRLMEMRSQSDPSEEFLESFAPNIAGIVRAYSSVDEDESKYLQIAPVGADEFFIKGRQGPPPNCPT
ncbi:plant-specific TFIIB-related protein PTF2-like [Setaria viridis]|uniref:plant-specific TFIIB-related protein PTF2-like n=1 Tax=Setaria viridis TaxID=4556 RepID=UPI003B39FAA1